MSKFIAPEKSMEISKMLFGAFGTETPTETYLRGELSRYIPQLSGKSGEEIAAFAEYHRRVYLEGMIPEIGRPLASLNPTFVDDLAAIPFASSEPGVEIHTYASAKENGYRMQIHRGADSVKAFTRQFNTYDLRMFPELQETLDKLPVMIGDAELINKEHNHLAGFNRIEIRIPSGTTYWPKPGEPGLPDDLIASYLANEKVFPEGKVLPDLKMTLSFHGLFAIAFPATWEASRKEQMENLITFTQMPINYQRINTYLGVLERYLRANGLNAKVVERKEILDLRELRSYVEEKQKYGLEGVCVTQIGMKREDKKETPVFVGPSIKIKNYETIDTALLGLYLEDPALGPQPQNLRGALVGLYDVVLGTYLPVTKVNLDPNGPQIKTEGQRRRIDSLRTEIANELLNQKEGEENIKTLYDTFLMQGMNVIKYTCGSNGSSALTIDPSFLEEIPRGKDLSELFELFKERREDLPGLVPKKAKVADLFLLKHFDFFKQIDELEPAKQKRLLKYFGMAKNIRKVSAKLEKPQYIVNTRNPIILETQVFDIKWGESRYAAGFHSWYGTAFLFENNYPERIRRDKSTTSPYETVHTLARRYTAKHPKTKTKVKSRSKSAPLVTV